MSNYRQLKLAIDAVVKANGKKEITGVLLNEVLKAMVNSLGKYYQFAGIAVPDTNPGTPDQNIFYLASEAGLYPNFDSAVIPEGVTIFLWDGQWHVETMIQAMQQVQSDWNETNTSSKAYIKNKPNIPASVIIDPVPTEDSPHSVASGGVYDSLVQVLAQLYTQTDINAIFSDDGKIYSDYHGGDIFYVELDGVRKYRVAYLDGTADAEHPVTIDGFLFYYADNATDAVWYSLRIKTVSTSPQILASNQKVQAQNNIVGKSYAPAEFSGLGKKVFAKNIQTIGGVQKNVMTQAFFQDGHGNPLTNTEFVIQHDFDLNGAGSDETEPITIPAGCVLNIDGGSISNGTLDCNNCDIVAPKTQIFKNVVLSNVNTPLWVEYFGAQANKEDNSEELAIALTGSHKIIKFSETTYNILEPIEATCEYVKVIGDKTTRRGCFIKYNKQVDSEDCCMTLNCCSVTFENLCFTTLEENRQYVNGLHIKDEFNFSNLDSEITKCCFSNLRSAVIGQGRGLLFADNQVASCYNGLILNLKYVGENYNQQPPEDGRGFIIRNNRFHSLHQSNGVSVDSGAIVVLNNINEDNIDCTFRGVVVRGNYCDALGGLIRCNASIWGADISNNMFIAYYLKYELYKGNITKDVRYVNNQICRYGEGVFNSFIEIESNEVNGIVLKNNIIRKCFAISLLRIYPKDPQNNIPATDIEVSNNIIETSDRVCYLNTTKCKLKRVLVKDNISNHETPSIRTYFDNTNDFYDYSDIIFDVPIENFDENNYYALFSRGSNISIIPPCVFLSSSPSHTLGLTSYPGKEAIHLSSNSKLYYSNGKWRRFDGNPSDTPKEGSTSNRPDVSAGTYYFDKSLKRIIFKYSNQWIDATGVLADVSRVGPSTDRPAADNINLGFCYYDTTLDKPIWAKAIQGTPLTVTWVDATGATV